MCESEIKITHTASVNMVKKIYIYSTVLNEKFEFKVKQPSFSATKLALLATVSLRILYDL